jgi:hypothetical protein
MILVCLLSIRSSGLEDKDDDAGTPDGAEDEQVDFKFETITVVDPPPPQPPKPAQTTTITAAIDQDDMLCGGWDGCVARSKETANDNDHPVSYDDGPASQEDHLSKEV